MKAHVVVDGVLGFGDAGKGSLVDYLVRRTRAHTVVRFNGGAQAAHNVVLPDGRHHTFAQFGSGTFVEGVRTHLSRFMLVDPVALVQEEKHLRTLGVMDALSRLSVEREAVVVTPFQRAMNRLREMARGDGRHGSCGMGIGETMADTLADSAAALRVMDLRDRWLMRAKLRAMQERKRAQAAALDLPRGPLVERELALLNDPAAAGEFADFFCDVSRRLKIVASAKEILEAPGDVVFEGAQGVLLDEWRGFHPYTTWSTTTFANAMTLLAENGYAGEVRRIGAMRAYMVRHGPGPFVTEAEELRSRIGEMHNRMNDWQRGFRVGWLDLVMLRYALDVVGGVDALAVTCLDHLEGMAAWKLCEKYREHLPEFFDGQRLKVGPAQDLEYQERLTNMLMKCSGEYETVGAEDVVDFVEERLGTRVGIRSYGTTWRDKRESRILREEVREAVVARV